MAFYKHASLTSNTLCQHLYVLFSPPKEADLPHPKINREHCKLSQHIYTLCTHSKFCFSTFWELPQYLRLIKLTLQSELEKCITLNHPKHSLGKTIWNLKGFFSSSGHSVADSCFMKANQSGAFCLFIYPLCYVKTFWLGKHRGLIHVLSFLHDSLPKIIH